MFPQDYENYTWIPHRPVIKTEEQIKIRPVFNCSLKTAKDSPSLNEAAYPGIYLMSSLLKSMLAFRTNKYTMLSDIKQAFLRIRLKNEFDNSFFFFFFGRGEANWLNIDIEQLSLDIPLHHLFYNML